MTVKQASALLGKLARNMNKNFPNCELVQAIYMAREALNTVDIPDKMKGKSHE